MISTSDLINKFMTVVRGYKSCPSCGPSRTETPIEDVEKTNGGGMSKTVSRDTSTVKRWPGLLFWRSLVLQFVVYSKYKWHFTNDEKFTNSLRLPVWVIQPFIPLKSSNTRFSHDIWGLHLLFRNRLSLHCRLHRNGCLVFSTSPTSFSTVERFQGLPTSVSV